MVGIKVKLFCNFLQHIVFFFSSLVSFLDFYSLNLEKLIHITFTLGFFIAGHMTETILYLKFFEKPLANFPSFFLRYLVGYSAPPLSI